LLQGRGQEAYEGLMMLRAIFFLSEACKTPSLSATLRVGPIGDHCFRIPRFASTQNTPQRLELLDKKKKAQKWQTDPFTHANLLRDRQALRQRLQDTAQGNLRSMILEDEIFKIPTF
jgi:hypothetical protein